MYFFVLCSSSSRQKHQLGMLYSLQQHNDKKEHTIVE